MPSDEELTLNVQQGDPDALTKLVERHHSPLLGFLYRMTGGDRALAEDLTQEAFLRVIKAIDQYQYPRPFKAWLYAIATNIARDHYKRAEARYTDSMPHDKTIDQIAVDPITDLEGEILLDEQMQQIADVVMALPAHQRETLILRYGQMLSLADISAALDIPLGTVKSRLSLGLRRLRKMMESET